MAETVPDIVLAVFFVFTTLLVGGLLKLLQSNYSLPYAPMILSLGLFLGKYSQSLGLLGQAVNLAQRTDPQYGINILLPIIIFKSSLDTDWHIFRKQLPQLIILAYPCVIMASILTSLFLAFAFPTLGFTALEGLLVGVILSCTDTTQIISILKKNGADIKLSSLVDGQSLLNDGSCVLLFRILLDIYTNKLKSYSLLMESLSMIAGGVLVGVTMGALVSKWMRSIGKQSIMIVNLSFLSVFLTKLICQNINLNGLYFSGIIAVTCLGLCISVLGKTHLSLDSRQALQIFWKYLVFSSESLILVTTGIRISVHFQNENFKLDKYWIFVLFCVYLFILAVKFVSILPFKGIISKFGFGCSLRDIFILSYGGMRGAITLAMSLIFYDKTIRPNIGFLVVYLSIGTVILSVLINGTTVQFLVRRAINTSRMQMKQVVSLLNRIIRSVQEHSAEAGEEFKKMVGKAQFQKELEKRMSILEKSKKRQTKKEETSELTQVLLSINRNTEQTCLQRKVGEFEEAVIDARIKVLQVLKSILFQMKSDNSTTPDSFVLILQALNIDLHQPWESLSLYDYIQENLQDGLLKIYLKLYEIPIIQNYAMRRVFNIVSEGYNTISNFITLVEQLEHQQLQLDLDQKILAVVMVQCLEQKRQATQALDNLKSCFPKKCQDIQTMLAARSLIHFMKSQISHYSQIGQLNQRQFSKIQQILDCKQTTLADFSPVDEDSSVEQFLSKVKPFHMLPKQILTALAKQSICKAYDIQQTIVKLGKRSKYLVLIQRGTATLLIDNQEGQFKLTKRSGQISGLESVCFSRYISKLICEQTIFLLKIQAISLAKIFLIFKDFQRQFWIQHFFDLVKIFAIKRLASLARDQLYQLLQQSHFLHLSQNQEVHGNFLLTRGEVEVGGKVELHGLLEGDIRSISYSSGFIMNQQLIQI